MYHFLVNSFPNLFGPELQARPNIAYTSLLSAAPQNHVFQIDKPWQLAVSFKLKVVNSPYTSPPTARIKHRTSKIKTNINQLGYQVYLFTRNIYLTILAVIQNV
jgi:hypothetical protein